MYTRRSPGDHFLWNSFLHLHQARFIITIAIILNRVQIGYHFAHFGHFGTPRVSLLSETTRKQRNFDVNQGTHDFRYKYK